jgi:hypothetical protein
LDAAGEVWMFGGISNDLRAVSDLFHFVPDQSTDLESPLIDKSLGSWKKISIKSDDVPWPQPRACCAGIADLIFGKGFSRIWMFGGAVNGKAACQPRRSVGNLTNELWCFHEETSQWEMVSRQENSRQSDSNGMDSVPTPRCWHAAAFFGGLMWVFGGASELSLGGNFPWRWDPLKDLWSFPVSEYSAAELAAADSSVHTEREHEWQFEGNGVATNSWPSARYGHSMCAHSTAGALVLFGGTADDSFADHFLNDMWSYSIANRTWQCLFQAATNCENKG